MNASTGAQAAQDLALIRQMMERSRRVTVLGGHHFVAWGLLVSSAMALTWLSATGRLAVSPSVWWAAAIGGGWAYSIWAGRRDARRDGVASQSGFHVSMVWLAAGVSMTLLFTLGIASGTLPWRAVPGVASAFVGAAVFIHGFLAGLPWLRNLSIGWWLAGAAMLWWPGRHTLLVYAGLILLLQVLPGLKLNAERRRLLAGQA